MHHDGEDECFDVTIPAGEYTMHLFHDGSLIDNVGKKAFLHLLQQSRLMGSSQNSHMTPNFMAFKGPNGKFVSGNTSDAPLLSLEAKATSVGLHEVWRLAEDSIAYTFTDGTGARVKYNMSSSAFFVGDSGNSDDPVADFYIDERNHWKFFLTYPGLDDSAVDVRNSNQQLYAGVFNATFTADYKGFDCASCGSSALPLQQGEVALFAGCDYKGPAIVFQTDVSDLSIYNGAGSHGLGMGDDMAASVRVGPNTFAILYEDTEFGGAALFIEEDIPCLDETELGSETASSFQVATDILQFILSNNTCKDCNLTGIDLSGLDLTSGVFSGADFSQANLTDTIFLEAQLDYATFSDANLTDTIFQEARLGHATISGAAIAGADFSNAELQCAELSNMDLTSATFEVLINSLVVIDKKAVVLVEPELG